MQHNYKKPNTSTWTGRASGGDLYLHEKVACIPADEAKSTEVKNKGFALLGYACDEGVRRNHGRVGAVEGPNAIRTQLGKLANHLGPKTDFWDIGDVTCPDKDMEATQKALTEKVTQLLQQGAFPLLMGGGHDIAYGHYRGLRDHFTTDITIGIINFDAHFDLRNSVDGNNSGTPFYQIAEDCKQENTPFHYLCLGIRQDANSKILYSTAKNLDVAYLEKALFCRAHFEKVADTIESFLAKVDKVYVTIDLDGFSSAYAPGVSAASPMGYAPDLVLDCLHRIIESNKLVSADVAELNPLHDKDDQTAKLAASLLHFIMHKAALL
jgi:formiminoglutamase